MCLITTRVMYIYINTSRTVYSVNCVVRFDKRSSRCAHGTVYSFGFGAGEKKF